MDMQKTVMMIKDRAVLFILVFVLVFVGCAAVQLYLDRAVADPASTAAVSFKPSGSPGRYEAQMTIKTPGVPTVTIPFDVSISGDELSIEVIGGAGEQSPLAARSARDTALSIISIMLVSGTFALLCALLTVFAIEAIGKKTGEAADEGSGN